MAIAPATLSMAHAVLQFPKLLPRDPAQDERLISALADEFPNVLSHQALPSETPAITPHLVLASSSSQLAISAVQADFEVRFYGEYVADVERGLEYIERKLLTVLDAFEDVGSPPMLFGLITTLQFSFGADGPDPARHILDTHLKVDVDGDALQDAMARVAVRLRETYFVTLTVSNYESRAFERPVLPGITALQIRPWEGRLEDAGVQLLVDINNYLEARTKAEPTVVTETGVYAVTKVLREITLSAGPAFVESGVVSVDELTSISTP